MKIVPEAEFPGPATPHGLSPYDSWARRLMVRRPDTRLVQPVRVRLRPDRTDAAERMLDEALAGGRVFAEGRPPRDATGGYSAGKAALAASGGRRPSDPRDATRPGGDSFLLYWDDAEDSELAALVEGAAEIEARSRLLEGPLVPGELAPPPAVTPDGSTGPVVAVIDDGLGFLNQRFRSADGERTRFHAIWLQAFRDIPAPPFGPRYTHAGEMLYRPDIDAILTARGRHLDEGAVYREICSTLVAPGEHASLEFAFTHGTAVCDIAAGAFPGSGDPAETWPLIGVQLPPEAVDQTSGEQLEFWIVEAVRWILSEAARAYAGRAVVINLSFASFAGPKDGTKAIEARVAALVDDWNRVQPARAMVVYAFGNDFRSDQRAMFRLARTWQGVDWNVKPGNRESAHAELRVPDGVSPGDLSVRATAPDGSVLDLTPLAAGASWLILGPDGAVVGRFAHVPRQAVLPGVDTPAFYLFTIAPTHPDVPADHRGLAGRWQIALRKATHGKLDARIEIQRGDTPHGYPLHGLQTHLDHPDAHEWEARRMNYSLPAPSGPITRSGTHSSFVTARSMGVLRVAAAVSDSGNPGRRFHASTYSAKGAPPVAIRPDLTGLADDAPGLPGRIAAGTISGSTRTLAGTSIAAAQATRAIATDLMSVWAPFPDWAAFDAWLPYLVATFGKVPMAPDAPRVGPGVIVRPRPGGPRRLMGG